MRIITQLATMKSSDMEYSIHKLKPWHQAHFDGLDVRAFLRMVSFIIDTTRVNMPEFWIIT